MTGGRRLHDAERQAAMFERTREARRTEIAEDYVELIDDLITVNGEARLVDLAERFGVSHVTANRIIARLRRDGLVTSRPYRSIFLTEEGRTLAARSRVRHQIVIDFLKAIGVSEAQAVIDSEGLEHHVSEETLAAFERFTRERDRGR
ncbi:MAG: manganese-binding transcriptional regulator MntR [Alphaproteobacteria bacterium]|nr:manganese-binding transcriptional regulator MntR [Alphaproteobacteria bacterium]